MRLTTKIFIGFLASVLSLILIFMFYLKTREITSLHLDTLRKEHEFEKVTEAISIPAPYSVVSLNRGEAELSLEGAILNHKENPDKVLLNKDLVQYTRMDVRNDTLFINIDDSQILDMLELKGKENSKSILYGYPNAHGAKIYLPEQNNMHIVNELDFDVYLDSLNINTLELMVSGSNNITINNSQLKTFTFDDQPYTDITFMFVNSHIGTWNIDAYRVNECYSDFSSSLVEVLNVRGDEACELPYIRYNTLNWFPSSKKASLSLKLQEATSIEMKK